MGARNFWNWVGGSWGLRPQICSPSRGQLQKEDLWSSGFVVALATGCVAVWPDHAAGSLSKRWLSIQNQEFLPSLVDRGG